MISLGIMTVTQLSLNFTEVIEEFPIVVRRRIFDEKLSKSSLQRRNYVERFK